jgi:soluble lytic murein transglycosylase-like protein
MLGSTEVIFLRYTDMTRLAGPLLGCAFALLSADANAQAGAAPPATTLHETTHSGVPSGPKTLATDPLTAEDVCRTLEQAATENALPIEFFARVIWQESRFNARAVSRKGAEGIAQFMPRTADWRGLLDPFDSIAALKASASYLRDLRNRFGNLGLAAAAYNAGPQRVQDWLVGRGSLPKETRSYIQVVTGHSASEWSGGSAQSNLALPEPVPLHADGEVVRSFTRGKVGARSAE